MLIDIAKVFDMVDRELLFNELLREEETRTAYLGHRREILWIKTLNKLVSET